MHCQDYPIVQWKLLITRFKSSFFVDDVRIEPMDLDDTHCGVP